MPEIDLFLDREDEFELVQLILAQGGRLVADMQMSTRYQEITDLSTYSAARANGRLFFVLFDEFFKCPLELFHITSGYNSGNYSIIPRVGGPTIDFLGCVCYRNDGCDWISDGGLSYYPTYENKETCEMVKPPISLINRFNQLAKHLKESGKFVEGHTGRRYWIGPHTYEQISKCGLKLGVEGLVVD